jgi:broad-specificity NMP kinase
LENIVSEAIDVILVEARSRRRRIWEVDTSGRSIRAVAAEVEKIVRTRPAARSGSFDWLSDPKTTAYLLDRAP